MSGKRKLIDKKEEKISYIQIMGFVLIFIGVCSLLISLTPIYFLTPESVSILFFIVMLGFAFAFPSLLKGNDGLSTMRIVVFMMTNVICMLLLKIGWDNKINSLKDIGLDQWWMGVIAFVFGAKATQSFFESKMAVPEEVVKQGMAAIEYSNADIAKFAVVQNEQFLKTKFQNIASISDAVDNLNNIKSHVVALYLKDDNTAGIPDSLQVKMPDGRVTTLRTEIITDVGEGNTHVSQYDSIQTQKGFFKGSICCFAKHTEHGNCLITSGHVYSNDTGFNYGGWLTNEQSLPVSLNGDSSLIGNWLYQMIADDKDISIVKLSGENNLDDRCVHFKDYYSITDEDIGITKVIVVSNVSKPQVREGYILDYFTNWPVTYNGVSIKKTGIIVIGSKNNRQDSSTLSTNGDSGGCVYEKNSKKLVGLILGGNNKFTWVLPIDNTLESNNFSLA